MSDLQAYKALNKAREHEEKRQQERRRNTLVLVMRYLCDFGYIESYEKLCTESNLSLSKVDAADNVDLIRIVQEFEESYESKFGKRPKLVRKLVEEVPGGGGGMKRVLSAGPHGVANGAAVPGAPPPLKPTQLDGPPIGGAMAARQRREAGAAAAAAAAAGPSSSVEDKRKSEALERRAAAMNSVRPPAELGVQKVAGVVVDGRGPIAAGGLTNDSFAVVGVKQVPHNPAAKGSPGHGGSSDDSDPEEYFERRVVKPLPPHLQGELRELGSAISRDIFTASPNVRWDDIAGLDEAKKLLKEAVVMPIKYPQLFTGLLAPWKGILLYGPPGTGKTMLAKAVATECKTTFFNVSASTIISKWRGDSEKLVRVLFDLARYHAPSTVFLDELDALMQARGGEGEHEASRRMKTELLIQMDGLARGSELVFVLAATNLPWELDLAMLRRLEKRILVPLPNHAARLAMLSGLLTGRLSAEVMLDQLAEFTEGYSGSDVFLLAKEAAMRPLRRLMIQLEGVEAQPPKGAKLEVGAITHEDVTAALSVSKPSARLHQTKYLKFNEEYGQLGS